MKIHYFVPGLTFNIGNYIHLILFLLDIYVSEVFCIKLECILVF